MIDVQMAPLSAGKSKEKELVGTGDEAVAVSLRGLTKDFGSVRAVDDLSMEIRRGETVALLGPNGAGKTTTVAMLLGLLASDSGTAGVLGMPSSAAIQCGRVGAMLQEGSLMPGVRVGELLDFAMHLRPTPVTRKQLIATAGLTGLEGRRVDRLSGGQTQRMRFALAIANDPEMLVLDEPTAAMDVEARHEFWASMREYASSGRTVLFATHYLEEAEAFASRVVIIAHGRVVADGTVAELKRSVGIQTVQFRSVDSRSQTLSQLSGVCHVETGNGQVALKTTDADVTVRELVASGLAWHDLEVRSASLEDVFMALVGNGGNGGTR
ncbi:MAG TPA: ABC transporter ATP-binding protein [Ktedonobacterales bacterium]|nr:ABC transporter ATP-binding protein [Ktedonobacterales bacterium]